MDEFNFSKLFANAESFFHKKGQREIQYPKGSPINKVHRSSQIVGNSHNMQQFLSKYLGIKK
ncbi:MULTISPECIES: hypothetical protein [Bacillaceae]|uniref:Uncharacterized protein n=2 Tax=Bacillus infantis TaxID=324767 RepID=U5L6Z1_9BACI|nr:MULTISPECIES: hypothetical protein [Bacillus]OXT17614.1 hypothetical protein B9K06_09885 [Bacillus sp. OG2]SIF43935.1 Uncharacterised protein [Mycobacteroides abscessus subsp. abscessus]AGX02521.1 hypothetical protein N288_02785 [Bacillus infantis NRRL B-14911]EAR67364.1 glutaminyl-tRNA synthetase [Bacillus sp. NRRL B-14911]MCA1035468.1 hypothetical protein [Bacillus infantis]